MSTTQNLNISEIESETQKLQLICNNYINNPYGLFDYFLDDQGFEGVLIFNDKPNAFFDMHYHNSDDYIYV